MISLCLGVSSPTGWTILITDCQNKNYTVLPLNLMPKSRISMKIRRLREKKGLTQEQLAEKAGLHRVSIAMIESGMRKNPDLSTRKKLAKAFKVKITELLD